SSAPGSARYATGIVSAAITSADLPSDRKSQQRPRDDPMPSPSGLIWVVMAKLCLFSINSTTWLNTRIQVKDKKQKVKIVSCSFHLKIINLHSFPFQFHP